MDFAVVRLVQTVETEAETPHGVYRHDERVYAGVFVAVGGDARSHVPDFVLAHYAEKICEHADLLLRLHVHHIAEGSEGACRRDVTEKSAVCRGILVKADKLAAAACPFRFRALVEGAEPVVYQGDVRLRTAVESAVESAVAAARDDEIVSVRRPLFRLVGDLPDRDVIGNAELGKELVLVYPGSAAAQSVDDYKTFSHYIYAL